MQLCRRLYRITLYRCRLLETISYPHVQHRIIAKTFSSCVRVPYTGHGRTIGVEESPLMSDNEFEYRFETIDDEVDDVSRTQRPAAILDEVLRRHEPTLLPPIESLSAKLDLSYVDPHFRTSRVDGSSFASHKSFSDNHTGGAAVGFASIVAKWIHANAITDSEATKLVLKEDFHASLETEATSQFTRMELQFLERASYTLEDVRLWASIITNPDSTVAAETLLSHSPMHSIGKMVPTFLFLYVLRRRQITAEALRHLLAYAWSILDPSTSKRGPTVATADNSNPDSINRQGMNDKTAFIMLIRLMRHARSVLPEALITIASMARFHLKKIQEGLRLRRSNPDGFERRLRQITKGFNRLLGLFSLPTDYEPYKTVAIRERAQFDLLQSMAAYEPPISVNRVGYRAIICVQLANKKTEKERDWGQLKVRSWPPWKENKTGLDANKDHNYGTSRALEVINRMREAGYSMGAWEHIAKILSGWDVDGSPTIQTRSILFATPRWSRPISFEVLARHPYIWAARLRTTRTIQEAWACFLECQNSGLRFHDAMNYEMLLKLYFRQPHTSHRPLGPKSRRHEVVPSIAGDVKEVFPNPISPKESTYVAREPPSMDEFADEIQHSGQIISQKCLLLLMTGSPSFSQGLRYLKDLGLFDLITSNSLNSARVTMVPHKVLTALIQFLCRFPYQPLPSNSNCTNQPQNSSSSSVEDVDARLAIQIIFKLLFLHPIPYRPIWHKVMGLLASGKRLLRSESAAKTFGAKPMRRYFYMKRVQAKMEHDAGLKPDVETLKLMCIGVGHAAVEARNILQAADQKDETSLNDTVIKEQLLHHNTYASAGLVMRQGAYILQLFKECVGEDSDRYYPDSIRRPDKSMPKLLAYPSPVIFHVAVRALGLINDWQHLLELVRWMKRYHKEIGIATDRPRQGKLYLRRTIIAIRAFAEREWDDLPVLTFQKFNTMYDKITYTAATEEVVQELKNLVEGVDEWGGWPSDEDVQEYDSAGLSGEDQHSSSM